MAWESVPPASQLHLTCKCVGPRRHPLPRYIFFFFFHRSSSSSCYHSMGTISTAYARVTTAPPSGGTQTTPPLLHLSPSPAATIAGMQVKICFFHLFFFRSFFDQCYKDPLYPTRRVLNPPASPPHNPYPQIPPPTPPQSPPPPPPQNL